MYGLQGPYINAERQAMLHARRRRGVAPISRRDLETFFFPRAPSYEESQRRVVRMRRETGTAPDTDPTTGLPWPPSMHRPWPVSDQRRRHDHNSDSVWRSGHHQGTDQRNDWSHNNQHAWQDDNSRHSGWRDPHQDAWHADQWNDGAHPSHWNSDASSNFGWNERDGWVSDDAARHPSAQRNYTTASASQQDIDMSDASSSRNPGTPYDDTVGDWPGPDDDPHI